MLLVILFFHLQFINLEKVISEIFKMWVMFKCLERKFRFCDCWYLFKKFYKKMTDNHEQTKATCWIQIWSGLFKVGNIFVFLRIFSFFKGLLLIIDWFRKTYPTSRCYWWRWRLGMAIAPPIYLTQCFIL